MRDVFICDAVRTPIGRFGGSLAKVRADAAVVLKSPEVTGKLGVFGFQPTREMSPDDMAQFIRMLPITSSPEFGALLAHLSADTEF